MDSATCCAPAQRRKAVTSKTYFIKPAEGSWCLVYDTLEFFFPIRGEALSTAIKAARIAAMKGERTSVVLESHDRSRIEVWRSEGSPTPNAGGRATA